MTLKETLKQILESGDASSEQIEWGFESGILNKDLYVTLHDGEYCLKDEAFLCEYHDEYYKCSEEDSEEVHVGSRYSTETWSKSAVRDHAFYCSRQEEYYSYRDYSEVEVEGETVCLEVNESDIYYWDSDEEYHWEPEPEEEEDDIPNYHDCYRPWERIDFGNRLVLGCELEIEATDCRADVNEIANRFNLIGERDGSLDDKLGIEIIGPPMEFSEYKKENNWSRFLAAVKNHAIGWDAGTYYGLHISVNRKALTDFHTGKLLVFIHSNQELCEKVAGRSANSYSSFKNKKISHGKEDKSEKHESLALRDKNRLEFRLFRSTLKPEGFMRCIEFVVATVEFTRNCSCNNLKTEYFKEWLKKREKTYHNLANHIFGIKIAKSKQIAA